MNVFYCGFDGERMVARSGKYSIYYACRKYEGESLSDEEKPCRNRISPSAAAEIDKMNLESNKLYHFKHYDFIADEPIGGIRKIYVKNRRIK